MDNSMEMDRGVQPLAPPPKKRPTDQDISLNFQSLETRLKDNFAFRQNPLTPKAIAKIALPVYLFTVTAVWLMGTLVVMPRLYRDQPESTLLFHRCCMLLIYLEMQLNWLCIRYVDSTYFTYLKKRWGPGARRREEGEEEE